MRICNHNVVIGPCMTILECVDYSWIRINYNCKAQCYLQRINSL